MKRLVILIAVFALLAAACSSGGSTATTAASGGIDGEAIYTANCVSCHSADLSGGVGKPLNAGSPAAGDPDAELIETITNGVSGTAMPAWGDKLSADEISAVLAYIRSVQNS